MRDPSLRRERPTQNDIHSPGPKQKIQAWSGCGLSGWYAYGTVRFYTVNNIPHIYWRWKRITNWPQGESTILTGARSKIYIYMQATRFDFVLHDEKKKMFPFAQHIWLSDPRIGRSVCLYSALTWPSVPSFVSDSTWARLTTAVAAMDDTQPRDWGSWRGIQQSRAFSVHENSDMKYKTFCGFLEDKEGNDTCRPGAPTQNR